MSRSPQPLPPPVADPDFYTRLWDTVETVRTSRRRLAGPGFYSTSAVIRIAREAPDFYDRLQGLAEHAARVGAHVAVAEDRTRAVTRSSNPESGLESWAALADRLLDSHMALEAIAGWMAVLASDPQPQRAMSLHDELLTCTADRLARLVNVPATYPIQMGAWSLVGAWGPLAYAAGLTASEALGYSAAGVLHEPTLRSLAALRGYRLPDPTGPTAWTLGEHEDEAPDGSSAPSGLLP